MSSSAHPELEALREVLSELQRVLLAALKKDSERVLGRVLPPGEWFQMLVSAPQYQWLKSLNTLLSDLDALSENSQVAAMDLVILRSQLELLFFKDNGDATSFNAHYRKHFAQNHDLVFCHGRLKQAYGGLPEGDPPVNSDEIRRSWHKIGASRRKLLN
jgi:hypothetical protein